MAIPTYQETLSTFVTSTLNERQKAIHDQIFATTPFLAWTMSHRKPQMGSRNIFFHNEYGKNTSGVSGAGRGTKVPLIKDEIITDGFYKWCTYMWGSIRYRDDDLENSGKYSQFDMAEAEEKNLVKTARETLETDLLGDYGSAVVAGTAKFAGLQDLIEDVDTAASDTTQTSGANTVGNLSRATYPWWGNWGRSMAGKEPSTYLIHFMREGVNNVNHYTGTDPEVLITHYVVRDLYEDEVMETLRTIGVKMGDVGFRLVEWKGIPFITSPYATQTRMYFMGRDTMRFWFEPRMWFKNTTWKEPTQQPFDFARQTVVKGAHGIVHPRGTSVLYGINT